MVVPVARDAPPTRRDVVRLKSTPSFLRVRCTALTADPPVPPTPEVVDELRLLHPGPTPAHRDTIEKLRPVSPRAVPDVDSDLVRRALATFASTSGAGPSVFVLHIFRMVCAALLVTRHYVFCLRWFF